MARASITLPNDLMARLEPLKSEINISLTCQIAIEAKVKVHERIRAALSREDVITGLVDRLKIQKAEAVDQSYAWGSEDGEQWIIRHATYEAGRRWGQRTRRFRSARNQRELDAARPIGEYGDLQVEMLLPEDDATAKYLKARRELSESNDLPFEIQPYSEGFRDAVRAIWTQIEKEL